MAEAKEARPTMQEIAEMQGVSNTAVSFVLRGRDMGIHPATQERILSNAISLKYHIREDKRINSLRYRVLFLVPDPRDVYGKDSYGGRLFAHMFSLEQKTGIQLVLHTSSDRNIIRSLFKGVCEDKVDAVIAINLGADELETVVGLSPVPVICLSLWSKDICSRIGFDDEWIGKEAARQFHHSGHRKAAVLTSSLFEDQRSKGFADEWKDLGGILSRININGPITMESVHENMMEVLTRKFDFSAIFCLSDKNALAVMRAVFACGLSVPEDISLIGCDNHDFTRFTTPPLSTFEMDERIHGEQLLRGVKRLLTDEGQENVFISNNARFIRRESVLETKTART